MTRLSDKAIEIVNDLHKERLDYASEYLPLINTLNKLARYEDEEEAGRLVRLPCKVGDTVYVSSRLVPKTIQTGGEIKFLDCDVMPKYFCARVVSFRFASREYVKLAVNVEHVVITKQIDDRGPDELAAYGEFCKIVLPLSSFGKTIFLTDEEVSEQILKETSKEALKKTQKT